MLKRWKQTCTFKFVFRGSKNCQQQFSRASTYGHKAFEIAAKCECARLAFDKNRLSNSKAICFFLLRKSETWTSAVYALSWRKYTFGYFKFRSNCVSFGDTRDQRCLLQIKFPFLRNRSRLMSKCNSLRAEPLGDIYAVIEKGIIDLVEGLTFILRFLSKERPQ